MALQVGDKAPEVLGINQDGNEIKLTDFAGKKLVLYFYPKDNTPGCTTEACSFRDSFEEFQSSETIILGISKDSIKKHNGFIEKHNLPFLLLSDEDGKVCEDYGVWQLKKMMGKEYMGIVRSTFLIDKDGNLVKEWRAVKVNGHIEEVLEFVKEMN